MTDHDAQRKNRQVDDTWPPDAHPYSPTSEAGGFVFVSGSLSIDPSGAPVAGRSEAVVAATERLRDRLATAGLDLRDVIKTTYFVTDVTLRDETNLHDERTFAAPRPARTFVEVSRLPYGATVEIEAVAYRNPNRARKGALRDPA